MAYPEGLLTSGERVHEHQRPHVRMLVVPALVPPLVAGVATWLAALLSRTSWHTTAWLGLAVLALVLVVRFSLAPLVRWWCTRLVVTDRRLLVREGVLSRSDIDVAASSIGAIRTRQRGLERLLGCGTLLVATHDAPDDPWRFHGIPHPERTAACLQEVAEQRGGGVRHVAVADGDDDEPDQDDEAVDVGELVGEQAEDDGEDGDVDGDLDDEQWDDEDDDEHWGAWSDHPPNRAGSRAPVSRNRRGSRSARRTSR